MQCICVLPVLPHAFAPETNPSMPSSIHQDSFFFSQHNFLSKLKVQISQRGDEKHLAAQQEPLKTLSNTFKVLFLPV